MIQKIKLMAHLVAGYPTDKAAMAIAQALVNGGASILEVQLPFSDPSADGPAIQKACAEVLSRGYRTGDGIAFIRKLTATFPQIPVLVMSYASLVYTPGIKLFCKTAAEAGVKGLIIPDLPFDHDEGLTASCRAYGMENIPVAAPSMTQPRLSKLAGCAFPHIYAALRTGITGSTTVIDINTINFLEKISAGGAGIYGGFGITSREQAQTLAGKVEAVVAGSVFVRCITENTGSMEKISSAVEQKARELSGL